MTMRDEFEKEFLSGEKALSALDYSRVEAWLKGAEAKSKISMLKRFKKEYYALEQRDMQAEISRLEAEIKGAKRENQ
jgi:hypothetical protein